MSNFFLYDREKQIIDKLIKKWRNKSCNVKKLTKSNNVSYQRFNNRLHDKTRFTISYHDNTKILSIAQKIVLIKYIDFLNVKKIKIRVKKIEIAINKMFRNANIRVFDVWCLNSIANTMISRCKSHDIETFHVQIFWKVFKFFDSKTEIVSRRATKRSKHFDYCWHISFFQNYYSAIQHSIKWYRQYERNKFQNKHEWRSIYRHSRTTSKIYNQKFEQSRIFH